MATPSAEIMSCRLSAVLIMKSFSPSWIQCRISCLVKHLISSMMFHQPLDFMSQTRLVGHIVWRCTWSAVIVFCFKTGLWICRSFKRQSLQCNISPWSCRAGELVTRVHLEDTDQEGWLQRISWLCSFQSQGDSQVWVVCFRAIKQGLTSVLQLQNTSSLPTAWKANAEQDIALLLWALPSKLLSINTLTASLGGSNALSLSFVYSLVSINCQDSRWQYACFRWPNIRVVLAHCHIRSTRPSSKREALPMESSTLSLFWFLPRRR